jgi:hypothetical protein
MTEPISLITKLNWREEASRVITDPLFELTHKRLPKGCHPIGERKSSDALTIEAHRLLRPWNNLYYTQLLRLSGKCLVGECDIREAGLCPLRTTNLMTNWNEAK